MNVGLIDVDMKNTGKKVFPTLTLMKLSAYHKAKGDCVTLLSVDQYLNGDIFSEYDKVYASCIFAKNKGIAEKLACMGVMVGGSGYDMSTKLRDDIEHIMPDYSLYNITDTAYGFLTRGCPRHCPFCIVADKEGAHSYKVADLSEWWSGQKFIKLLDPNILACPESKELLSQLVDSKSYIDVTQGMDARLLHEDNIELVTALKIKTIHFAWDNPHDEVVPKRLKFFKAHTKNLRTDYVKHKCYVLTNFQSTIDEDLYRIQWLRENNFDPYVMIYNKENAPKKIRELQRWCNNKMIFRSEPNFEKYRKYKEDFK